MLRALSQASGQIQTLLGEEAASGALAGSVWIDLLNGSQAERTSVEAATGLHLPTEAAINEIEMSSRLGMRHGVLYLNMPLINMASDAATGTSVGFVLSKDRLITTRFAASQIFDLYRERLTQADEEDVSAPHIFLSLLEAIVDRQADALEYVRDELEKISHGIFLMGTGPSDGRKTEDKVLKRTLGELGRLGDLISHIRDTQVAAARIVPYVATKAADWLPAALHPRLETLKQDIASISDFDTHLNDKTQFLLDATMGFINIAQNNVMKVMAIASVVGIPPVLVAGVYGMNFKNIPEYDWAYGYAYGWAMIILTTLIPLAIFRWRKWI
jgi:magnesium transporter